MTKNKIINILPEILDISYGNMDFGECLQQSAMQNRALRILGSKENNWLKPLYDDFVSGKARGETRGEFVSRLSLQMDMAKGDTVSKCGVLDFESLANVFDVVERERKHDFSISAPSKEMENISDKAEFMCVIIDRIAKEISLDANLKREYLNANSVGKKAIIMAKLKSVNTCLGEKSERVQSLNRWMPYYVMSADKAIKDVTGELLDEDKDNKTLAQMYGSFEEMVEKDEKWFEASKNQSDYVVDFEDKPESTKEETSTAEESNKKTTKKFGDLYPRGLTQKQIAKRLQPFNIAAGIKFLNQLLDAFQELEVTMN